ALGPRQLSLGLFLGAVEPSAIAIGFADPSLDRLHIYLPALAACAGLAALGATKPQGGLAGPSGSSPHTTCHITSHQIMTRHHHATSGVADQPFAQRDIRAA